MCVLPEYEMKSQQSDLIYVKVHSDYGAQKGFQFSKFGIKTKILYLGPYIYK